MLFPIKIASRSSPLALAQVTEIIEMMKAQGKIFEHQIISLQTGGDKDKATPLTQSRDNFFTDALDQSLLEGQADIAIHSAKDLPQEIQSGLKIFALTKGLTDKDAWVSHYHWKDLPVGARVGTSSVLRQQQILQMRPDVQIINIRGNIQERLQLVKEGKVDGIVVAACALERLKLSAEIKDIFPWEGMPLQGQLAVVGRGDDYRLEELFTCIDIRRHYGKVSLVGAGPGDPELITVKAIKALELADCIFYDYLLDPVLLKYAPHAQHIYAGKRKGEHSLSQKDLSRALKEKVFTGKRVVRLKGGDPLIFGRGADEIQYLRSYHIHVEVIPGITSATGIPSSLGVPLTARGIASSVVFLSGHEEDEDRHHPKPIAIPHADTLVFLMGLTKLDIILESLRHAGWKEETPIMIVSNGTKAQEHIIKGTIANIKHHVQGAGLKPPALIIIGKITDFYKNLNQKTFLHCGTHPHLYQHLGKIVSWPMIEIQPVVLNESQHKELVLAYEKADLIVLTSWYAAENFFKIITPNSHKVFAVIGQRTSKALEQYGIKAAIVSFEETAEGLFKAIVERLDIKDKKILLPRSSLPNPFLKNALMSAGASVTEMTIYKNTKPPRRNLPDIPLDGVIFTSPSTVRNFLADYVKIPTSWVILAKGPVTLKTLAEAGYHATSLS